MRPATPVRKNTTTFIRNVPATMPMVSFEAGQYSVPANLLGQTVWVRVHGRGVDEQVVIVHVSGVGPVEVARHRRASPGSPALIDEHFPPAPAGALQRRPKAKKSPPLGSARSTSGRPTWCIARRAGAARRRSRS